MNDRMLNDEILLGLIKKNSGGGGGGTTNYNSLENKPQIDGVTLTGNKTASDLGLASASDLEGKQDALTAGQYISIDAQNEITVNREIPNESFTYEISGSNDIITVTKKVNGAVVFTETHDHTYYESPKTYDEAIKIDYYNAGIYRYELLVASDSHEAGFIQTWAWWADVSYTENFSTIDNTGKKLIIKSEMDTALTSKQDKTDNNLTTTDKTTTGAINELKSGLTELNSNLISLGLSVVDGKLCQTYNA